MIIKTEHKISGSDFRWKQAEEAVLLLLDDESRSKAFISEVSQLLSGQISLEEFYYFFSEALKDHQQDIENDRAEAARELKYHE